MIKDLIKENGNQATIGSIPQLTIPRELTNKLVQGTAVWADFEAVGITKELIKNLIANRQIPRLVVQDGRSDTECMVFTGTIGYVRVSESDPTVSLLGVEAGALMSGETGFKVLLEFVPENQQEPFNLYYHEV